MTKRNHMQKNHFLKIIWPNSDFFVINVAIWSAPKINLCFFSQINLFIFSHSTLNSNFIFIHIRYFPVFWTFFVYINLYFLFLFHFFALHNLHAQKKMSIISALVNDCKQVNGNMDIQRYEHVFNFEQVHKTFNFGHFF